MYFIGQSNASAGTARRAARGAEAVGVRIMAHGIPSLFASRSPTAPYVAARPNVTAHWTQTTFAAQR